MRMIDAGYVMKAINRHLKHLPVGQYEAGFNDGLNTAMLEIMAALTQSNEPLTLAELREMEGEPVWVEHNNGGEWLVIHWDYVGRITTAHKACLLDYEYGRTWLVYRHPLEGEANG